MLEKQAACRPFSRACAKTGKRIAARMAIMAMTTSSSIRVNPRAFPDADVTAVSLPERTPRHGLLSCLTLFSFRASEADSSQRARSFSLRTGCDAACPGAPGTRLRVGRYRWRMVRATNQVPAGLPECGHRPHDCAGLLGGASAR